MAVEVIPVTDREQWLALRQKDVTASVVGSLLGVHEYTTAYGLHMLKSGAISEDPEENEAMIRGRLLEDDALELLRMRHPDWKVWQPGVYLRDPDARLGATPDAYAERPDREGFGVVQVKTVVSFSFRDKWFDKETGTVVPPLWIVAQAITEAHLAGASWACVVALSIGGVGLDLHVIDIPIHPGIVTRIREETAKFWARIEAGTPPDPDYARDAGLIHDLYGEDDGSEIDLSGDNYLLELVARREVLKVREADGSAASKERKVIDAEIILKMGSAAKATLKDGSTIDAKTIRRGGYTVEPSSYRRITVKGPKRPR